ncbi:MAG: hypothetical protein V7750_11420 [Sneathiella sp.]
MKKIFIVFSTLLSISTFIADAEASDVTPVDGVVIEQDRGGVPGLEFPPQEQATTINNGNQEFVAKGRLGYSGVDYFTFTMDTSFDITLDFFDFEKEAPANSNLSTENITYKFILVGESDLSVTIPQENLDLFTNIKPGTYMLGITSPVSSAAKYDVTITPTSFLKSLPLLAIGIGFGVLILLAGGLIFWKKSKT